MSVERFHTPRNRARKESSPFLSCDNVRVSRAAERLPCGTVPHANFSRGSGRLPPRLNAPLPALGLPSSPASDTDIGHTHSASKNELSPRYKDNDVSSQRRYTTRPTHGFDSNTRPEICRMLLRAVTDQSHRPPVISARETRRPSSPLQSTDPTRRLPRDLRRPN